MNKPESCPNFEARERLHFLLGAVCNNNCLFCMEDDRKGRQERAEAVSFDDMLAILRANVRSGEVIFVSAEPTLHPRCIELVREAAGLGYRVVGITSNGRMFAYREFTRRILDAGLNHAVISVHGPDAGIHDGLTRTPGSFEQVQEGLRNLRDMAPKGLFIQSSTVVCRRNWEPETLLALSELLTPYADQMVLNVMQPFGRGKTHIDRLMPRYSELKPRLAEFFRRKRPGTPPVYVVDVPYCCLDDPEIPVAARGFVERYVHFMKEAPPWEGKGADTGGAPERRALSESQGLPDAVGEFRPHRRDSQEAANKTRLEFCNDCSCSSWCDGVWTTYLERFGDAEFRPLANVP